jgi:hypothetical protein
MKNAKLLFALLLLSLTILFSNCSPDHNFVSSTEETLTRSNWSVDYYFETQDLTSQYGDYRLLFGTAGTISAQKGNEIIQGTWDKVVDVNTNEIVTINFNTTDLNLQKLNQGWKLVGTTSSTLQFEDYDHLSSPSQLRIRKQ